LLKKLLDSKKVTKKELIQKLLNMNPDRSKLVEDISNISTSQMHPTDMDEKMIHSISNADTRQECDVSADESASAV